MAILEKESPNAQADDLAIIKALEMVDSLARDFSLAEIQELATKGSLQQFFPALFDEAPTPELPGFDDIQPARGKSLSQEEFVEFLKHT